MKDKEAEFTAYGAMALPNFLGGATGVDVMSQLINGTVDAIKKRYSGIERRNYLYKNIIGPGAKPKAHEVFAGLILVYEMSGTLYPDSPLQQLQGRKFLWFEKIANALGLDPRTEAANAYAKVLQGKEYVREHPPEEEMIERLFKTNQSNKMVQAIGGGAKVWKMADK